MWKGETHAAAMYLNLKYLILSMISQKQFCDLNCRKKQKVIWIAHHPATRRLLRGHVNLLLQSPTFQLIRFWIWILRLKARKQMELPCQTGMEMTSSGLNWFQSRILNHLIWKYDQLEWRSELQLRKCW